jgi:hypothetical protein
MLGKSKGAAREYISSNKKIVIPGERRFMRSMKRSEVKGT